jgi:hypothetical protein
MKNLEIATVVSNIDSTHSGAIFVAGIDHAIFPICSVSECEFVVPNAGDEVLVVKSNVDTGGVFYIGQFIKKEQNGSR